jgi:hypothetical protein
MSHHDQNPIASRTDAIDDEAKVENRDLVRRTLADAVADETRDGIERRKLWNDVSNLACVDVLAVRCDDDAMLRSVTLGLAVSLLSAACALVEQPPPPGTRMFQAEVRSFFVVLTCSTRR